MKTYYAFFADIHGNSNALTNALHRLEYWEKSMDIKCQKIFLGDYIDRGLNPNGVLALVKYHVQNDNAIALLGNHDDMLTGTVENRTIEFGIKEYPITEAWDKNNGPITCEAMFGVKNQSVVDYIDLLKDSWQYDFLKTLPLTFQTKHLFISHSPQTEKEFTRKDLLWGKRWGKNPTYIVPNNKQGAVHGHVSSRVPGDKIKDPYFNFPRIYHFEHGGRIKFIALCDIGCDDTVDILKPVIISEDEVCAKMEAIL